MGYKLVKFNVVPEENEQIDAIIKVPKEPRSVIHGVVLDECNRPKKDAVVKLLKMSSHDPKRLEPITHTFTDEHGQFLFGPLCPHVKYVIKVWINHVKTRELVIKPEECNDNCIENPNDDHDCNHNYRTHNEEEHEEQIQIRMSLNDDEL
ncbi:carboxypeptidase regulatory-like domain-containing protein [Clostridium sp. SYSU_GA19001]|uniref:carboxypeptidase regulatory-like domain-containing protein n=1 Tax=Clostridium caldaquaticum TaxID=2940653 RepID=UPI0020774036|nr:carboxypeptidase regulatory-like domain-containing protein [Clostridium caldaquaticum]MCM8709593.1 carboxypeptidase regulatory-like domain-containing protein [Clostridium caldaquaticum]